MKPLLRFSAVLSLACALTAPVVSASDAEYADSPFPRGVDITVGVGLSALFLSSSLVGFRNTSKCREVLANREDPERSRPGARRSPPRPTVGPRVAEQARTAQADAGSPSEADAGTALPVVAPDKTPEPGPPAARQRTDPE